MAYRTSFDQSNKADWAFDVTATDADTEEAIDFTGATVSLVVKDENNCQKLSAEVDDGITINTTTISVLFTDEQMKALCAGSYKIGMVYELNDETNQLLVGTVAVYDGVASI